MAINKRFFIDQAIDLESEENIDLEIMNQFSVHVKPMLVDYSGEVVKNIVLAEWKIYLAENGLR